MDEDLHGKLNTYNNKRCRCAPCKKANSDYWRVRREAYAGHIPENCELCGEPNKLAWDHHHATVTHRGWICQNCNSLIGKFRESPELIRRAQRYLAGEA